MRVESRELAKEGSEPIIIAEILMETLCRGAE